MKGKPILLYAGKTKNVYKGPIIGGQETCFIEYTDKACGTVTKDGEIILDPGQNDVVGVIKNKHLVNRQMSETLFGVLEANGIATHRVRSVNDGTGRYGTISEAYDAFSADEAWDHVYLCSSIGRGLEWIVRNRLTGSFIRRYGHWFDIPDMTPCAPMVEVTIKDDERGDPMINPGVLIALGAMNVEEVNVAHSLVLRANTLIKSQLACAGMDLIDIKFELGRDGKGALTFMDEISLDIMRVYKNGEKVTHEMMLEYLP